MKSPVSNISELVASVTSFTRGVQRRRQLTHPTRDWWMGLSLWFVLAIGLIMWSGRLYLYYQREGSIFEFDTPVTSQLYRPELVAQALDIMAERSNERQRLLQMFATVEQSAPTTTQGLEVVEASEEMVEQAGVAGGDGLLNEDNSQLVPGTERDSQSVLDLDPESVDEPMPVLE